MSTNQPKTKVMTERQWRNFNKKLDQMQRHIEALEKLIPKREKRWLKFDECLPPGSVCADIASMMYGITKFTGFIGRLSDYYGCSTMDMLIDRNHNKVSDKAIATYYPSEKTAYSKGETCSQNTVLHEFFHHMVNCNVVIVNKSDEEYYADRFAQLFQQRAADFRRSSP